MLRLSILCYVATLLISGARRAVAQFNGGGSSWLSPVYV